MPTAAPRYCAAPGCTLLVPSGRCPSHTKQHSRAQDRATDARRGTRQERGYTRRWYRATAAWIADDPARQFCADPYKVHGSRLVMGQETDHIVPHRGDYE